MASELERAARELYEHASRHTTRGGHEVGVISIEGLVVLRFMESVEDLAIPPKEPEGDGEINDMERAITHNVRALVRRAERAEGRVSALKHLVDELNEGLDARIEQIRELREAARVQPRRMSREEFHREILDSEITPTEGDDHG